jgi:hypothetical protein
MMSKELCPQPRPGRPHDNDPPFETDEEIQAERSDGPSVGTRLIASPGRGGGKCLLDPTRGPTPVGAIMGFEKILRPSRKADKSAPTAASLPDIGYPD